jgi:phage replication-related protein YjqB (UPF0714/DUF867 family)
MADKYANFAQLSRSEVQGVDFGIRARVARSAFAIVAPHGGGIEPGTSEVADAVAAAELSFYAFDGLKPAGNADLHITSTRFDEPICLTLISRSTVVLTVHGEHGDEEGAAVYLGGLDETRGRRVGRALAAKGFDVRRHQDPRLQGRERTNLCNRGASGQGVQLELSRALRRTMFSSLSAKGRKQPTARFRDFVGALRSVLIDVRGPLLRGLRNAR